MNIAPTPLKLYPTKQPRFSGSPKEGPYTFSDTPDEAPAQPAREPKQPGRFKTKLLKMFASPLMVILGAMGGTLGGMTIAGQVADPIDHDAITVAQDAESRASYTGSEILANSDITSPDALQDKGVALSPEAKRTLSKALQRQDLYNGFSEVNDFLATQHTGVLNLDEAVLQQAIDRMTPAQIETTDKIILKMAGSMGGLGGDNMQLMMDWYDEVLAPNLLATGQMSQAEVDGVRTQTLDFLSYAKGETDDLGGLMGTLMLGGMGGGVGLLSLATLGSLFADRRLQRTREQGQ